MPKEEPHHSRKSREGHAPYTKSSTTRSGEDTIPPVNTGSADDQDLQLVLRDTSSAGPLQFNAPNSAEIIPGGHSSSELTQSQTQSLGSFFQMSRNVNVHGGEFTSSHLHHTNLTINIGRNSGGADAVEVLVPERASVPNSVKHEVVPSPVAGLGTTHMEEDSGNDLTGSFVENPSTSSSIGQETSSLPVQKSSEIYYRHLATKGRGSPLWSPEPNNMLPIEYQRRGIGIGDVGIITDSGGFDFLFNICLPLGDPINPEQMPENYKPLSRPESRDLYSTLEFKEDSYLASSLVETSRRDGGDSPGLVFESSAIDGAVLTMPSGSISTDLRNVTSFRKYAISNAEKWYRYANEVRGRETRNGDLRLVVGYNCANAWGMAAFANHVSEQSGFRLRFMRPGSMMTRTTATESSLEAPRTSASYEWECSGTAVEVKSGPDPRELEILQPREGSDEQPGSGSNSIKYENQTLFIRTLNITLQDAVWNRLSAGWDLDMALDDDAYHASEETEASVSIGTSRGVASRYGNATTQAPSKNQVYLSHLPVALNHHPSTVINRLLLYERPDTRMAVTEDTDWISVIDSDEAVLPESESLFSRMKAIHEICEEEGAVFFKPGDLEAVSPPSTPPPLGERTLNYPESLSRLVDSRVLQISRFIDPEQAYPTPLLFESRRSHPEPEQSGSTSLNADVNPQPASDVSFVFPQRSESQPPSTPPSQTSSAKIAEIVRAPDPETLYPTPETLPLHLRR